MFNLCFCGVQAGYAHDIDCPYPLFRGSANDEMKWETARQRENAARLMGEDAGRFAASWVFDDRTTHDQYLRVLRGIEDGDPEIMDGLPASPLSVEWAGDSLSRDILEALDVPEDDDAANGLLDRYAQYFESAARDAVYFEARRQVLPSEPYVWPGGYAVIGIMDDGETLCYECLTAVTNPVHFGGDHDGWRFEGIDTLEGHNDDDDEPVICAHCSKQIGGN